jgi:putative PIN family toxin of toxin-antitoxin system
VLRVVLDANVFVSAYIQPDGTPGRIIQAFLRDSAFDLVLTEVIIDEVLEALAYPKVQKAARSKIDPELWFEDLVVLSLYVTGDLEMRRVSKDPDDDKYLAGAVEGRAEFLVTGDVDLLRLREYEGIQIVTPRAFLDRLNG